MNRVLSIFKHEVFTLISRFSFWFGVLGIPIIGFLIYAGINWINQREQQMNGENAESPIAGVQEMFTPAEETRPQGFVDPGGLIQRFPEDTPPADLIAYASESEARRDLDSGKISAYYVIPADYVDNGKLKVYVEEFNLVSSGGRAGQVSRLIAYNLLGGEQNLADLIDRPIVEVDEVSLAPQDAPVRDKDSGLTFFLPYSVSMFFMFSILGSAGMMLNSVAKEKENRIMEVLLLSASPHQLLLGKIVGLGIVGLMQVLIWSVSAFTLMRLSGQTFNLPPEFLLDPSILVWGIVFFLLGYLIYAALLAGVGALVPNLREASQATFIVSLPLMIPLFLISALIDSPNGALSTALSLFPLTSPPSMMLRLAAGSVPLWQILLAVGLLLITTLLVIRAVAGLFRAQTIMTGQSFQIKRFFLALIGKG